MSPIPFFRFQTIFWGICLLCFALTSAHGLGVELKNEEGITFFESKIRPVLVESCFECHSASSKKLKGGLRLDSREDLIKGGDSGAAIDPANPEASLLIKSITYEDNDLQMPPDQKKRLPAAVVNDFKRWIASGAVYPPALSPSAIVAKTGEYDFEAASKQWAFRKPVAPEVPKVQNANWAKTDLDRFILQKLEQKNLRPAPEADKRTLIRRATYDLTGLPPTTEETESFLRDGSIDAFEKVVDRLLNSPHYGEKWGRHWLDVVRYTDSFDARGIGGEADVPEAYRYRDWVVNAFNTDLPYNEFIKLQVAGDLIPAADGSFNTNGLIATGMYALGEWGIGDADKEKMLTDIVDDQIDVTGRAFLGLTLACARCHDHKFDPIPTRDYYGMAGIFFSSHILPGPGLKTAGSPVLRIPLASPEAIKRRGDLEKTIKETERAIESDSELALSEFAKHSLFQTGRVLTVLDKYKSESQHHVTTIARENALPEPLLRAWLIYLGWSEQAILSKYTPNVAGNPSVAAWKLPSNDNPSVTINSGDQPLSITTLTLPPRSVSMHPSPKAGVSAHWTAPEKMTINFSGSVADSDAQCGDGIDWTVLVRKGSLVTTIASGSIPNGGKMEIDRASAATNRIEVNSGDSVELVVGPKGGYECDTTTVELQIAETSGLPRKWSLTADVLHGPRTNPLPDSYNNPGVWSFHDAATAKATEIPVTSLLGLWLSTTNESARAELAWNLQSLLIDSHAASNSPEASLVTVLTDTKSEFWQPVRASIDSLPERYLKKVHAEKEYLASMKARLGPNFPVTHGLQEGGTPDTVYAGIHDTHINIRGRYDRPGNLVPRHFPTVLGGREAIPEVQGSGRLQLATWIASTNNPLTARVMVNRIWQHHFGEGIVRTPNNYGKLGTPPTHPELLDYLAIQFIKSGWSIKTLHRMMMLSATYRQSTIPEPETLKVDPDNLLFGHMHRRRLESEELRDTLLAVSGRLDHSIGGASVRDLNILRRTLYVMTVRSDKATYQALFDAADPVSIVEKRINSTVAPQALFLMNHPFALAQARALAERVVNLLKDDPERIRWVYSLLYNREPSPSEVQIGLRALQNSNDGARTESSLERWEPYCEVLICANEFIYLD